MQLKLPTMLYDDCRVSIILAKNNVFHKRTKHIDASYHFTRPKIESRDITMMWIHTSDNIQDMLTKPMERKLFIQITI